MGPPPPLHAIPSMHPAAMHQQQFSTFALPPGQQIQQSAGLGIGAIQINDDSMWQDPNGYLRKWQRDTGTSIWGDPAKQCTNVYCIEIVCFIHAY